MWRDESLEKSLMLWKTEDCWQFWAFWQKIANTGNSSGFFFQARRVADLSEFQSLLSVQELQLPSREIHKKWLISSFAHHSVCLWLSSKSSCSSPPEPTRGSFVLCTFVFCTLYQVLSVWLLPAGESACQELVWNDFWALVLSLTCVIWNKSRPCLCLFPYVHNKIITLPLFRRITW